LYVLVTTLDQVEPLPLSSPLWRLPNVLLTAHNADFTSDYFDLGWRVFGQNLRAFTAGGGGPSSLPGGLDKQQQQQQTTPTAASTGGFSNARLVTPVDMQQGY
jgi:hypothetical protein